MKYAILSFLFVVTTFALWRYFHRPVVSHEHFAVSMTEAEWKAKLKPMQFRVLRKQATERAFTGKLYDNKQAGVYYCAGCHQELFSSKEKFHSGTGWPSFWAPATPEAVGRTDDYSLMIPRVEVHCSRCGGHLGHVFTDGPKPTGLRYCINSAALTFEATDETAASDSAQ
ncbi:MAG: peptide-methionine (R)-S-oxide reductase MsrB [Candidatus Eremiobacteraeota bacterium]|nr:peptide-methionine (R)-S-oxide reductase MsrB [Candidatus Eremiobacteraeota bacterium]